MRRGPVPAPLGALLAVALILGTAWSLVTPPFQAPDEPAHVAYAQTLAETGDLPGKPGRSPFTTEQTAVMFFLNSAQVAANPYNRAEWSAAAEGRVAHFERIRLPSQRSDGGGPDPADVNPPLSYLVDAAAYRAVGGTFFDRLWAMRMTGVLGMLLTVLGTWLLAGEAFGRRRLLQFAAAGAVALVPMVGFVSGAVGVEGLLYGLWTLALWLGLRLVRRGLTTVDALCFGLAVGAACTVKAASFALLPGAAFALAVAAWRARVRMSGGRIAVPLLAAGAGVLATFGTWFAVSRSLHRAAAAQVAGTAGGGGGGTNVRELLSYLWQFYLPRLPFQTKFSKDAETIPVFEYWIKGATADFGWLEVHFANPVYLALTAVGALVVVGCAVTLWRRRARIDWMVPAFLAVVALTLLAGLHWTDYHQIKSGAVAFAQGRYLLPLVGVAGLVLAGAVLALPARARPAAVALALGGLVAFNVFSFGLVLERYFA